MRQQQHLQSQQVIESGFIQLSKSNHQDQTVTNLNKNYEKVIRKVREKKAYNEERQRNRERDENGDERNEKT